MEQTETLLPTFVDMGVFVCLKFSFNHDDFKCIHFYFFPIQVVSFQKTRS
jgi:hypothetical protein